ncbi:MAG: HEAT repeat domain-containing protein [Verrucomicrobiota bacterium]
MRKAHLALIGSAFLVFALARPCNAMDWNAFDDPKDATYFINAYGKSISVLSAPEKAAAIKRLKQSLKSREVEIRRRAALTLGEVGETSGVPTMIDDLSKATGRDRGNVVVALRVLKDKRAIPALRMALKDESAYVRGIAVLTLGELKATEAYDEIVSLTKDKGDKPGDKNAGGLDCVIMPPACGACYALGALGDERAIPILIEVLTDNELQWCAQQALEALTKQKFGHAPDKWKAWWKAQKP